MRLLYISIFLFACILFVGCEKEASVTPASELEGGKASTTYLMIEVFDREATEHQNGSCDHGSEANRDRVMIKDASVELYFTEAAFINGDTPEMIGNTGSRGKVGFSNLVADHYFVHVDSKKGEINQFVSTPKGKYTTVRIGL